MLDCATPSLGASTHGGMEGVGFFFFFLFNAVDFGVSKIIHVYFEESI